MAGDNPDSGPQSLSGASAGGGSSSRATIAQGVLEGLRADGIHKFLGIRYAAPPIDELRWHEPRPPASWAGVRDAKAFGPACLQTVGAVSDMRVAGQSEDCLFLNVWTSTLDRGARRPVMVWIHGGGNLGGAGSEAISDGTLLAVRGAVVISFNYRLGAFGFLFHEAFGGNFAVQDQLAALRWVGENIEAFGGDPDRVTIFGQSAGAVAVRSLLSCPAAEGLFHRAILQSAGFEPPAFALAWSRQRAEKAAESLFDRIGTSDPALLRRHPAEAVKALSHELSGIFPRPGQVHTPANLVWMPVPDGRHVCEETLSRQLGRIPLLMGCTHNEARYFLKPDRQYPDGMLGAMAGVLCGRQAEAVIAALSSASSDPYASLDLLFTTAIFHEPALATRERVVALGGELYVYRFDRVSPGALQSGDLARHTADIPYVFGTLGDDPGYDADDSALADLMQTAWLAFAGGCPPETGGRAWPRSGGHGAPAAIIGSDIRFAPIDEEPVLGLIHELRRRTSAD